jgi:hypothetical protein
MRTLIKHRVGGLIPFAVVVVAASAFGQSPGGPVPNTGMEVIEFPWQTLTFAPTRADMTVSQVVFTVYASDPAAVLVNGARSNANFMYIDLKRVTTNQFELPPLKIEFPTNAPATLLCLSVKVWFAEVSNQYDSHFYQNLDDRYALVAWCNSSPGEPPVRARFKQNRVATLAEFKEALRRPFALKLKATPLRKEWAP